MNPYARVTCLPFSPKPEIPANPFFCLVEQCSCPGGATVEGCFPYPEGECHRIYAGPNPVPGPNAGYAPMWDTSPCNNLYSEDRVIEPIPE